MIIDSHMRLLQEELEALRERLRAGDTPVSDVRTLQRVAERMLADGKDGPYEPALTQIHSLLDAVVRTMYSQARLRRMAANLPPA